MQHNEKKSRNETVIHMYEEGSSLNVIGEEFGISRQRIQQIVKRLGGIRKVPVRRKSFRKDLTGKSYGNVKVLSYHSNDGYGQARWICECRCGNKKIFRS